MTKTTLNPRDLLMAWAPHMNWDPDDKSNTYSYDRTKINHCTKRHFEPYQAEFEAAAKDTLYKAVSMQPLWNIFLYVEGKVTVKQLIENCAQGIQPETKRYPFLVKEPKEDIEIARKLSKEIWKIRASGVLDFDMSKVELKHPDMGTAAALNKILSSVSLPPINVMVDELINATEKQQEAWREARDQQNRADGLFQDMERLQEELRTLTARAMMAPQVDLKVEGDGKIPSGNVVYKKASEIFGDMEFTTDFMLPVFEWEHDHPMVPNVDPHYIFRVKELTRVLYAIVTNKRAYLQGHTGSGKTTLVEQVAAYLKFPFIRINFDSEIQRSDLIGRDTLKVDDDGHTVSVFVDGILPVCMSQPGIVCFDEIDFVRPDVAYVMQAATEGNGLRIAEDGDRVVNPHPLFRMFATGNTVGQGDEQGMYQGARPQSLALLDRFTVWIRINYLEKNQREELVKRHAPTLSAKDQKILSKYMDEHLEAFLTGSVNQPISPRGMLAIAEATTILGDIKEALTMCVLDRASSDDRAVLNGLVNRVC